MAPATISLGERSSRELLPRLLPEDRCFDFVDELPLDFDDEPPLDFEDDLRLDLFVFRRLDSAMVKPLFAR
jgi:hypothetical protein